MWKWYIEYLRVREVCILLKVRLQDDWSNLTMSYSKVCCLKDIGARIASTHQYCEEFKLSILKERAIDTIPLDNIIYLRGALLRKQSNRKMQKPRLATSTPETRRYNVAPEKQSTSMSAWKIGRGEAQLNEDPLAFLNLSILQLKQSLTSPKYTRFSRCWSNWNAIQALCILQQELNHLHLRLRCLRTRQPWGLESWRRMLAVMEDSHHPMLKLSTLNLDWDLIHSAA